MNISELTKYDARLSMSGNCEVVNVEEGTKKEKNQKKTKVLWVGGTKTTGHKCVVMKRGVAQQ